MQKYDEVSLEENLGEKLETEKNAWDILEDMAGSIEAPEDWSQEHARYPYN